MIEPLLKPSQQKRKESGLKEKKSGRIVATTVNEWKKIRWELFVKAGRTCVRCGCELVWSNVTGFFTGIGDDPRCNFHAHHSRGTRGLGGGQRDDRIFIPIELIRYNPEDYSYLPEPPSGMGWNLLALCNNCHMDFEHNQGCKGTLQWSAHASRETSVTGTAEQNLLFEICDEATSIADKSAHGDQLRLGKQDTKKRRK